MCLTASLEPRADLQGWGVTASIQAFCLLLGTCCVLGTALSTGKGMNKTGAVPVLRELTPQGETNDQQINSECPAPERGKCQETK